MSKIPFRRFLWCWILHTKQWLQTLVVAKAVHFSAWMCFSLLNVNLAIEKKLWNVMFCSSRLKSLHDCVTNVKYRQVSKHSVTSISLHWGLPCLALPLSDSDSQSLLLVINRLMPAMRVVSIAMSLNGGMSIIICLHEQWIHRLNVVKILQVWTEQATEVYQACINFMEGDHWVTGVKLHKMHHFPMMLCAQRPIWEWLVSDDAD